MMAPLPPFHVEEDGAFVPTRVIYLERPGKSFLGVCADRNLQCMFKISNLFKIRHQNIELVMSEVVYFATFIYATFIDRRQFYCLRKIILFRSI